MGRWGWRRLHATTKVSQNGCIEFIGFCQQVLRSSKVTHLSGIEHTELDFSRTKALH
jgi:hypothetical protein